MDWHHEMYIAQAQSKVGQMAKKKPAAAKAARRTVAKSKAKAKASPPFAPSEEEENPVEPEGGPAPAAAAPFEKEPPAGQVEEDPPA